MLEIFYKLIIFNTIMFVFGTVLHLTTNMTGEPGNTGVVNLVAFGVILLIIIGALGIAYLASYLPVFGGTATSPLNVVYVLFGGAFQTIYIASWLSFWNQLITFARGYDWVLAAFGILFTFMVESVFVIGFIQMTTGGWEAYK